MTPSAGYVFQGRDNTGAAAIVNSEQNETFIDGMINKLATDKLRLEKKKEQDAKAFREEMDELDFDPTGIQDLDEENEGLVVAAEDYAVEQLQLGKNPLDPTTPEGKEFIAKQRAAKRNAAVGKGATNQFNLAVKAANEDGVDKAHAKDWIAGYKAAKPNEGETIGQAKARYVSENPYEPQKMVGMYDFVADILPNLSRTKNGRVSELDRDATMGLLNERLLSPEGGMIAKSEMRTLDLDYGNPDDVQKYLDKKYKLLEAKYSKQEGAYPSSSSSSGGGSGRGGKNFTTTYTNHENAYKSGGKDNAIALTGFPAQPLNLPDGTVVSGSPQAIIRDNTGALVLEYSIPVEAKAAVWKDNKEVSPAREKGLEKRYIPYDLYRADIENIFGRDITEDIPMDGGGNEAPNAGKKESKVSSGGIPFEVEEE